MDNDTLIERIATHPFYLELKSSRDPKVLEALKGIDRANFLPEFQKESAYRDTPLRLTHNIEQHQSTCSQPSMVAYLADALELKEGMSVLTVGTGSGYFEALVKTLIGDGHLTTVEFDPVLAHFGESNLRNHFGTLDGIEVICADGSKGYPRNQPYDRITIAASYVSLNYPDIELGTQLNEGGIFIYPCNPNSCLVYGKKEPGKISTRKLGTGIKFVPIKKSG
jgi:protein-L-isoaspartate(D-aspartate) O-methyltransferase